MTVHFEFRGKKYPIDITYYQSIKILPEKFGINLGKIFTDGEVAADTIQTLILDDEKTLDLCWHYLDEKTELTFDDFLQTITGKDLDRFREDFWAAVVNFSSHLKKDLLQDLWKQFKKDLKKASLTMETSDALPSTSKPEESI